MLLFDLICLQQAADDLGLDGSNLREMFSTRQAPLPFYQNPETKVLFIEQRVYEVLAKAVRAVVADGHVKGSSRFMSRVRAYMLKQSLWTDEQLQQQRPPVKRGDRFMHPPLPWPERSDIPEGSLFTDEDW